MVAAKTDVILLELDRPEGGVELAVLVLAVHIDTASHTHQRHHHHNDDGQHNYVELAPGDTF